MKIKCALTVVILLIATASYSQESIIGDISYPYLEKLINTAKENYPRIKYFQTKTDIAKTVINRQKLSWFDSFTFSYFYPTNSTINLTKPVLFTGYQFGVNVNLGSLLQKPSNVKQAKQELQVAESEQAEYNLNIESELKQRYFTYIQKLNSLKLRSKQVMDAESMVGQLKIKYEKSELSFEDYSKALITSSDQKQSKLQAEAELLMAKATVEELLGKKLEDVK